MEAEDNPPGPVGKEGHAGQANPIRVLLANLSGNSLKSLTQLVESQSDMLVVGQVRGQVELLTTVASAVEQARADVEAGSEGGSGVDVVILGASLAYPPPGVCSHLFSEFPHLKILVLRTTGDSIDEAVLYWLGLQRQLLKAATPLELLASIRQAYALDRAI